MAPAVCISTSPRVFAETMMPTLEGDEPRDSSRHSVEINETLPLIASFPELRPQGSRSVASRSVVLGAGRRQR